jgi:hypothetical protein
VKNVIVLLLLAGVLVAAMFLGMHRSVLRVSELTEKGGAIPSIGRIQVLNGCGTDGAANKIRDFLRTKGFDVKSKGDAPTSNYPFTIIVSRKKDMSVAHQVAGALGAESDKVILMRNGDETYDVTVFVGSDFPERIK